MPSPTRDILPPGSPARKQQSKDAQKVLRLLAHRLKGVGFERTKPSFFVRPRPWVIEFIHLHKYTFGPCFRTHLGIRVRADDWSAAALNGPTADGAHVSDGKWTHRFEYTSESASFCTCAEALADYVIGSALSWFEAVRDPSFLLAAEDSPLYDSEKDALRKALGEGAESATSAATRRLLNVT